MYFYNARWYDPKLARFTQADTIIPSPADPQSWNRYAYVNNNPINYNDPSGHCIQLDEGFCLHEDIPGRHYHIVDGSGLFANYVETAIADYITSGDEQVLNRNPKNTPGFMVAAAMENACVGLGYDCGTYFRETFWIAVAGALGMASHRYSSSSTTTLSGSISQDILGDPDCVGCGYRLPPEDWRFRASKSQQRWTNQMTQRGWTTTQITEAIQNGAQYPATNYVNGHPATRNVHPVTGRSVIVDNITHEVIRKGGDNFDY